MAGGFGAARRLAGRAFAALPEPVRVGLFPARAGYRAADVPGPVQPPDGDVRLYIAPANSAGQGWAWARAAERLPGVGAVDMQFRHADDLGYPADYDAPRAVVAHSLRWGRAQFAAVAAGFTHVLAESQLPVFGAPFRGDVVAEHHALSARGVRTASLCHGSDIRLPSRHREREPWSPFTDDFALTAVLEDAAQRKAAILDALGGPEFVSTPDLLVDRPGAVWLPVVVDPERWQGGEPPATGGPVRVLHAPSAAGLKGTQLVLGTLHSLAAGGVIDLRLPARTPAERMPALVRDAEVFVDQFSLGIYGVAACEAMAAGRIVVSHVSEFVREAVRSATGLELPIVEATADTLGDVLREIGSDPHRFRAIAAQGPAFVAAVHDGRRSAAALAPFLGVPAAAGG